MRVEVREPSPLWKIIYGKDIPVHEDVKIIPETSREVIPRELDLHSSKGKVAVGLIEDKPQDERPSKRTSQAEKSGKNQPVFEKHDI